MAQDRPSEIGAYIPPPPRSGPVPRQPRASRTLWWGYDAPQQPAGHGMRAESPPCSPHALHRPRVPVLPGSTRNDQALMRGARLVGSVRRDCLHGAGNAPLARQRRAGPRPVKPPGRGDRGLPRGRRSRSSLRTGDARRRLRRTDIHHPRAHVPASPAAAAMLDRAACLGAVHQTRAAHPRRNHPLASWRTTGGRSALELRLHGHYPRTALQPRAQPRGLALPPLCRVKCGAPRLTRTADLRFRKPLLYPAELWARRPNP